MTLAAGLQSSNNNTNHSQGTSNTSSSMTSTTIDDVEAVLHGENNGLVEEDYCEDEEWGARGPMTTTTANQGEDETEKDYMSAREECEDDDLDLFQSTRGDNGQIPPLRRSNCSLGEDEYRDKLNDMFGGKGGSSGKNRFNKGTDSVHTSSTHSLLNGVKPMKRLESMFARLEDKAHEKIFQGQYTKRECTYVLGAGVFGCFNYGFITGVCALGLLGPDDDRKTQVGGLGGTYTSASLNMAQAKWDDFGYFFCLILSYILGSCLVSLLAPNAKPYEIDPKYGPAFMLGSLFLLLASVNAALDEFTTFDIKFAYYLASAANGVQNGIASLYSANLIRCSVTGNSIDLGLAIGKALRGNHKDDSKLYTLVMILVMFMAGAITSFYAAGQFLSRTLLISAFLFFLSGISLMYFIVKNLNLPWKAVITGQWMKTTAMSTLQKKCYRISKSPFTNKKKEMKRQKSALNSFLGEKSTIRKHLGFSTKIPSMLELTGGSDLMKMFDEWDADGDGHLDSHELLIGLLQTDPSMTMDEVSYLVQSVDVNNDGRIDREEWQELIAKVTDGAHPNKHNPNDIDDIDGIEEISDQDFHEDIADDIEMNIAGEADNNYEDDGNDNPSGNTQVSSQSNSTHPANQSNEYRV